MIKHNLLIYSKSKVKHFSNRWELKLNVKEKGEKEQNLEERRSSRLAGVAELACLLPIESF